MTSLKPTPGWGQSGTSRIFAFRSTRASLRGCADRARRGAATRSCASSPSAWRSACLPGGAPGCASAAPARSRTRAGRLAIGRRCGTCGDGVARSRSLPAVRRSPRSRHRSRCRSARRRRRAVRAARTPRARGARRRSMSARSQSDAWSSSSSVSRSPCAPAAPRSGDVGFSSSSRITFSGRNSSRCSRRIVSRRSSSSSPNSR